MSAINKKELEHLADLARLELHEHEKERLLKDLGNILAHFEELKGVNTDNVIPVAGGTNLTNVFREDEVRNDRLKPDEAVDAFPEAQEGYLVVPAVFE